MAVGFAILANITLDKPLAYLLVAMFVVGLGLGQLMQTLTMAVQAAAPAADIGVATSSATFFRQIGGTLGTAIMLSMLFSSLPANISTSLTDKATITAALDAALDPAVATAPANRAIMAKMWTPVTTKITDKIDTSLSDATDQVKTQVEAAVRQQVSTIVHAKAAEGTGKLADGLDSLGAGLNQLSTGTGAFVSGVGKIGGGATGASAIANASGQLSSGLTKLSTAEQTAASTTQKSTTDYAALASAMKTLGADQQACTDGDSAACGRLASDNTSVQGAMTALATSVYTTSGYLNGGSGKPGLATGLAQAASGSTKLSSGLTQLASGAQQLATGANTAASKGSLLTSGTRKAASGTTAIADGAHKLSAVDAQIEDAVAKALPDAEAKALQKVAGEKHFTVVDGRLAIDYADPVQRQAIIDSIVPGLISAIRNGSSDQVQTDPSSSNTSFLTGADPRLTKPFLSAFNTSVVSLYWTVLTVMLFAFVITLFYRVPPLRTRSALEEKTAAAEGMLG